MAELRIPLHKSVFINGSKCSKDKITYHEINSLVLWIVVSYLLSSPCLFYWNHLEIKFLALYVFSFSCRRRRPIKWNLHLNCKFIETVKYSRAPFVLARVRRWCCFVCGERKNQKRISRMDYWNYDAFVIIAFIFFPCIDLMWKCVFPLWPEWVHVVCVACFTCKLIGKKLIDFSHVQKKMWRKFFRTRFTTKKINENSIRDSFYQEDYSNLPFNNRIVSVFPHFTLDRQSRHNRFLLLTVITENGIFQTELRCGTEKNKTIAA